MIKIRKARASEFATVKTLCDDLLLDTADRSVWSNHCECWIAVDNGDIVAFGSLKPSVQYRDVVYFNSAGVAESHRGLGLQRKLIRARLAWARKQGKHFAITDTVPENAPSARNLIACGFRPYSPKIPWKGSGACYWSRKL